MNIFVGNLNSQTTEKHLENLFISFGEVRSVKIVLDNYTRRSRGFAFVDMPESSHAEKAIEKLNNSRLHENSITVNEARARDDNETFGRRRH